MSKHSCCLWDTSYVLWIHSLLKNIPICFLPALPGDNAHLVLAKHDTGTLFGGCYFFHNSICHWCLVTVIFSKCSWTSLSWSALTAPVVIRTGVVNLLCNTCVKNSCEKHQKYQRERKVCLSFTLYLCSYIHGCGFFAAQKKAWRLSHSAAVRTYM